MSTLRRLSTRQLPKLSLCRFQSTLTVPTAPPPPPAPPAATDAAPLSRLPTSSLMRALLLHQVTSRPSLMSLGTKVLLKSADNLEQLRPLKWMIDKSFYAHFCAGSTPAEIAGTMSALRNLGYNGIILAYAREVEPCVPSTSCDVYNRNEIEQWRIGTLRTIALTSPGDFVAIKLTGAGPACNALLSARAAATPELAAALDEICAAAKNQGVGLLVDAEQAALQEGVETWALEAMRRYNAGPRAVVFNTYQMYLKRSPEVLQRHLRAADREGWRLGVKLVRGAYLGSDPRELIHDTKSDTDTAYDDAAAMLIERGIDTVVASHNKESVRRALNMMRQSQTHRRRSSRDGLLVFAQLMGMADELSLSLVGRANVLKYAVWGSTGECVKYLLRRAEENKDAVGRTEENYAAVVQELKRRKWGLLA